MLLTGAGADYFTAIGGTLTFAVDAAPSDSGWHLGSALSYHISIIYYINSQYRIANFNTLYVPYTGQ